MKKILLIMLSTLLLTGCIKEYIHRTTASNVTLAKEACTEIGHIEGTQEFLQCVEVQTLSIRNARVQAYNNAAAANARAEQFNRQSMGTTCRQDGEFLYCN